MPKLDRRSLLTGAAATGLAAGADLLGFARAWAQTAEWKPEPGASLSILRWKRFIPSEDEAFLRIHVQRITRRDPEKERVKMCEVFQETAPLAVAATTFHGA